IDQDLDVALETVVLGDPRYAPQHAWTGGVPVHSVVLAVPGEPAANFVVLPVAAPFELELDALVMSTVDQQAVGPVTCISAGLAVGSSDTSLQLAIRAIDRIRKLRFRQQPVGEVDEGEVVTQSGVDPNRFDGQLTVDRPLRSTGGGEDAGALDASRPLFGVA